jgi:tRNA G18 (ribose-2'-O)-methylase SpoU
LWDTKVLRAGTGAHFRVPILKDRSWTEVSELLPNLTSVLIADNRVDRESDYNNRVEDFELPLVPYYSINYNQHSNTAVVIGGETEGLSIESFHLAKMFNGARITVPLSNGLESLNSSHALCIILFEIRRQLMTSSTNQK